MYKFAWKNTLYFSFEVVTVTKILIMCYKTSLSTSYVGVEINEPSEINKRGDLNKVCGDAKNLIKLISVVPHLFGA